MCAQVLPLMESEKLRLLISSSFIFYLKGMLLAEGTENPNKWMRLNMLCFSNVA